MVRGILQETYLFFFLSVESLLFLKLSRNLFIEEPFSFSRSQSSVRGKAPGSGQHSGVLLKAMSSLCGIVCILQRMPWHGAGAWGQLNLLQTHCSVRRQEQLSGEGQASPSQLAASSAQPTEEGEEQGAVLQMRAQNHDCHSRRKIKAFGAGFSD